ncbi:MAG: hypothetical protein KKF48_02365 [Nanoarchaeota archaeon]|nr:hypothetical protein [Nanoarchaeota archaeon]MBU1027864.1 hypothetical protein [Nanoarchaeota archaeon]
MIIKNLYIRNSTAILNENKIRKILKEIGIKRDYVFSDCYKKCNCGDWVHSEGTLIIDFSNVSLPFIPLKEKIKILFKNYKQITQIIKMGEIGCFYKSKEGWRNINIYPALFMESGRIKEIPSILKHEIIHLIYNKKGSHCENEECFFHKSFSKKSQYLCESCKKKFDESIKIINGEKDESTN